MFKKKNYYLKQYKITLIEHIYLQLTYAICYNNDIYYGRRTL